MSNKSNQTIKYVPYKFLPYLSGNEFKLLTAILFRANLKTDWQYRYTKLREETGLCNRSLTATLNGFPFLIEQGNPRKRNNVRILDYDKLKAWMLERVAGKLDPKELFDGWEPESISEVTNAPESGDKCTSVRAQMHLSQVHISPQSGANVSTIGIKDNLKKDLEKGSRETPNFDCGEWTEFFSDDSSPLVGEESPSKTIIEEIETEVETIKPTTLNLVREYVSLNDVDIRLHPEDFAEWLKTTGKDFVGLDKKYLVDEYLELKHPTKKWKKEMGLRSW